ncbi:hypothetical protein [Nitrospirillum viridazoti]|uniref:Uncharacterized protein n=1 Tax=Nitrospirillum viridazoti CBAmc TaxID=1441467 RepID=A0A248JRQ6_9PROT|nr:hypothetical protein [Nitrospirillum amazonense]ASG21422.1 hypothetical protein Y958_11720 [Nitrospirillum amazonense CBAmc]TWB29337.1 hypothetical protein FBZ91_1264 [Nitrospirillum amazonense]
MEVNSGEVSPLGIAAILAAALGVAVRALSRGRRRRREDDDGEVRDGLSERVAVLSSRLDRAEQDIANDKQGRAAFAATQGDLKAVGVQLDNLANQVEAVGGKLDRHGANLTRAHERIDDLHRLVAERGAA